MNNTCRDDLEQVRILADQCRRREKLRKRALASWQQNMRLLHQQAVALDQQRLHGLNDAPDRSHLPGLPDSKTPKTAASKKQHSSGKSTARGRASGHKQAVQMGADVAEATEDAQAKFEHDMALSLQLTRSVADEATKLHHVKIVKASSGQPALTEDLAGADADLARPGAELAGPSVDVAGPSGQQVCLSIFFFLLFDMHIRGRARSV